MISEVIFAHERYVEVVLFEHKEFDARLTECKTFNVVTKLYDVNLYRIECLHSIHHNEARYELNSAINCYIEALTEACIALNAHHTTVTYVVSHCTTSSVMF